MTVKIDFLGDISLNDDYISAREAGEQPFESIMRNLKFADLVVGNLESICIGDFGENKLKKPRLKTTLDTLEYLCDLRIGVAQLAHNHIYDNLEDGLKKTLEFLKGKGIGRLGAGFSKEQASKPFFWEKDGIKFCFLNYVTQDTNPNLPIDCSVSVNFFDMDKIAVDIEKVRGGSDFIIVLPHWGGRFEGGAFPDWQQPVTAREIIDFGADLIIGSHSHTLQPYEIYKGKYIFYSLGNFCFSDIDFEERRYLLRPENLRSAVVSINFSKDRYDVTISKIKNLKGQIKIGPKSLLFFRNLIYKIMFKFKTFWAIYVLFYRFLLPVRRKLFYSDRGFWGEIKSIINRKKT